MGLPVGYYGVNAKATEQARVISAQSAQAQATQQAREEAAALLKQIEQYRKRLPPTPDPSWLIREALKLGKDAGLELTTINQESPQALQQFTRLSIGLQFSATYHELGTFLDQIERSEHFIRVERLEVSNPDEEGKAAVRLGLSTIYVPPVLGQDSPSPSRR